MPESCRDQQFECPTPVASDTKQDYATNAALTAQVLWSTVAKIPDPVRPFSLGNLGFEGDCHGEWLVRPILLPASEILRAKPVARM